MSDYTPIFQAAAQQYNLDPDFLRAVSMQESRLNPAAISSAGAAGLMGLMPPTAKEMGVSNILDPQQNIMGGAKYLRQMIDKYGNLDDALSAYNWGPGNFDKYKAGQIKQMPNETAQYPDLVAGHFGKIKQNAGFVQAPPTQSDSGNDPIVAALSGKQPTTQTQVISASDDPIVAALSGKTTISQRSQQPVETTVSSTQQVPGAFHMGVQDAVRGLVQNLMHGISWGADKIAPNSQFAKDFREGTPQVDQAIAQQEQAYQQNRQANAPSNLSTLVTGKKPELGTDWGRLAGNVVGTAPLAFAAPQASGGLLNAAALGATTGAANALLTPVTDANGDFASKKLSQIGTGAATGAVAAPLVSLAGKAIAGVGSAAQRKLADAGVTMTPGQILGGGAARTEEKLTSVPVLGDMIKNAQQRSVQSFNKATYDQVLEPLGQKYSGPVGNEGVATVQKTIGDAYDNALSRMTFKATDPAFQSDITNLANLAQNLPEPQQRTFANVLKTQVFGKLGPQGSMDGETLKGAQSELSRIARGYAGDASFDNQQLGKAIGEIKNAIDNSLPRYNAAEAVDGLAKANVAWANFVRLRGASSSQGAMNNGGVFTAAQLANAVRSADKSVGKGATATGNALMQDFATAGQNVLGSKYPDSGTAGRSLLGLAAGAAAGHAFLPAEAMLPAALGVAAGAAPYSKIGQRLAQTLLMERPQGAQALGAALARYGSPVAPALGAALLNGANR